MRAESPSGDLGVINREHNSLGIEQLTISVFSQKFLKTIPYRYLYKHQC